MIPKIAALGLILSLGLFAAAGMVVQKAGFLVVDYYDKAKDERVFIPFPMVAANAALFFLPARSENQIRTRLGFNPQGIQDLSSELQNCPDGPFVEVQSRKEHVSVTKKGRNLLIDIESTKETVHIQIPIDSTMRAMSRLANTDIEIE